MTKKSRKKVSSDNKRKIMEKAIQRLHLSNKSDDKIFVYFTGLQLENIRCFNKKQFVDLSNDKNSPNQWTIILGNNGTGKTTILQSLVAMLPSDFYSKESIIYFIPKCCLPEDDFFDDWLPFRDNNKPLLERQPSELMAGFGKKVSDEEIISQFHYGAIGKSYWDAVGYLSENIKINCFAYGASRKAGETSISEQDENSSYITLFEEASLLINPEEWLLQADYATQRTSTLKKRRKENLEKIKDILIKVLPDINEIRFEETGKDGFLFGVPTVKFHTHYGWVEAKDLSLGYRTSMAWIVDFASRMFDLYPESENPLAEPAVVLIDEIDLHLHPKWQRELLDYLSNLFPNTQFIVTTHSPLIVQSAVARDANIVVCRREGDHVVIDQSVEAVRNWRADQILTSDLFGLETARPKEIEPFLEEREKILSKAKLTKKDEKRLTELENKIGFMPVSENPEDDKAMDIIRRAAERLESQK